ncbi:DEAD-box ATP-dependent RNA helicase [Chloropicon primus]|uniref:DEAD-box ATP-dependent RNA helicase 21 n=2 Tax=Chloropicon primus TaxID=1764295 RepID=A0A5B8MZU0_9CHLO|nr:DEAD-box ATP-dependent RNA helicase [Chloropicon primus]UPR04407.1 DEAD-box ATP-dependent RNA helicase [Chloropicon primus]|eukprot:QDZ25202.1 DEAD-box ATP-dependent RNA helicase [Chloropicon primus]
MSDKKGPVSLEDLLKRKKNLDDTQSRPVFMSKKRREELRKLEEEEEERKKGLGAGGSKVEKSKFAASAAGPSLSVHKAAPSAREEDGSRKRGREERYNRGDWEEDRNGGYRRERYRGGRDQGHYRREDRRRGSGRDAPGGKSRGGQREEQSLESEKSRELKSIKLQYLGAEKELKAKRGANKYKLNFGWDATEDTTSDLNTLYQKPVEASLLFGRGRRAGAEIQGISRGRKSSRYDIDSDKHWSEKALEKMTERDWRIFREDHNISYKGVRIPKPFRSWDDAGRLIQDNIMQAVRDSGYKKPSPIQMAAMPIGLQQRDVIGVAETGSGKTCAFVLPMLAYISKQPPMTESRVADGPYAIVLAPTRELAQQIEEETVKFARHMGYKVVCVVGGQSIMEQGAKLRQGCEIVIATPGRLLDCLQSSYAVLNQCNYVVLDEADRMIDMGFEPQVQGILDSMPSTNLKPEDENVLLEEDKVYRTTYMFSATMPPAVERLAKKYLRAPVVVTIGRAGKAGANVAQTIRLIKDNEKPRKLQHELEEIYDDENKQCIVFVNTKSQCNTVARQVERLGHYCCVLHGGKAQEQRETAIKDFKTKRCNVLVATDVAGRGIDVADVTKVINYDMPDNIESYTHRIGRTGRAGKKGHAVSLLTMGDEKIFYDLVQLLKEANQKVPGELAKQEAARTRPGSGFDSSRGRR